MNDNAPCCAHCKVELKHIDYPSGTRSDYWECSDCKMKFLPASLLELNKQLLPNSQKREAMFLELLLAIKPPPECPFCKETEPCSDCYALARIQGTIECGLRKMSTTTPPYIHEDRLKEVSEPITQKVEAALMHVRRLMSSLHVTNTISTDGRICINYLNEAFTLLNDLTQKKP